MHACMHACMHVCASDTTVAPALVCAMFQDFGEMMRQNWLAPVADVSGFEELPIQRGTVYSYKIKPKHSHIMKILRNKYKRN